MLPRRLKIGDRARIEYVLKRGQRVSDKYFQLRFLPTKSAVCRFALVVSKKVSKSAVERNKVRRRIYSAIGKNLQHLGKTCYDVVALISPAARSAEYKDILAHIIISLKKVAGAERERGPIKKQFCLSKTSL